MFHIDLPQIQLNIVWWLSEVHHKPLLWWQKWWWKTAFFGSKFYHSLLYYKSSWILTQHSLPFCMPLLNKVDLAVQSNLSLLWHMFSMHIQCFWQLMKAAVFTQAVVPVHSMLEAVCVLSLTMLNSVQPQAREEKNYFMMHTHLLWQSQMLLSWRAGVYKGPNGHTGGSLVTRM